MKYMDKYMLKAHACFTVSRSLCRFLWGISDHTSYIAQTLDMLFQFFAVYKIVKYLNEWWVIALWSRKWIMCQIELLVDFKCCLTKKIINHRLIIKTITATHTSLCKKYTINSRTHSSGVSLRSTVLVMWRATQRWQGFSHLDFTRSPPRPLLCHQPRFGSDRRYSICRQRLFLSACGVRGRPVTNPSKMSLWKYRYLVGMQSKRRKQVEHCSLTFEQRGHKWRLRHKKTQRSHIKWILELL